MAGSFRRDSIRGRRPFGQGQQGEENVGDMKGRGWCFGAWEVEGGGAATAGRWGTAGPPWSPLGGGDNL